MRFTSHQFSHAEKLLSELLPFSAPADTIISRYFRQEKKLGQADRAFIAEVVYSILRHKRSLSARCGKHAGPKQLLLASLAYLWGFNKRELGFVIDETEDEWFGELKSARFEDYPAAVRLDLPDWLYEMLVSQYGADVLTPLALSLNKPAPLDLRINPFRIKRDQVLARFADESINAEATPFSPYGIRLVDKRSLVRHPLFLDGSIEVQDEGSQLLCLLLQPKRGEMVADFCAGAGGKTLLLGAQMNSQGMLYAFDVSEKRLLKMRPRLARSGLSNVRPLCIDSENDIRVKRLAGKFDRVLVDAPCSGLGTLRRNPDMKWRQTESSVKELTVKQASILKAASALVKKGGRLVYATCSLLAQENEAIVSAFLEQHPTFVLRNAWEILGKQGIALAASETDDEYLRLLPSVHGTDGFFAAVMERI